MYIRIHTYTTHVGCALYLLKESGGIFFFGMDHNTWCQLFSRTVGKHRGVAIPYPSPPQTVLCQCYQNKWHILFFYELILNHFYSAEPVREIFARQINVIHASHTQAITY